MNPATMNTYFLSDPLMMLQPPGPSALKILVEVPDCSDPMKPQLTLEILEAVRFRFGDDTYQQCIDAMKRLPRPQFPIDQRTDVKEDLPKEHWTAVGGWRIWFVNALDDHYKFFN